MKCCASYNLGITENCNNKPVLKTLTDFRDTWAFLNGRVRDAFDFKKSVQEVMCTFKVTRESWWTIVDRVSEFSLILQAQYLAEAIGAGMGNSLQGFMNSVFKK